MIHFLPTDFKQQNLREILRSIVIYINFIFFSKIITIKMQISYNCDRQINKKKTKNKKKKETKN